MADAKNTDNKAEQVKETKGSLSAEAAYAAAASATSGEDKKSDAAPVNAKAVETKASPTVTAKKPVAASNEAKPAPAKTTTASKPAAKKKAAVKKAPARKTLAKKTATKKVAAKSPVKKTATKTKPKGTVKMTDTAKKVAKNTKAANTKAANRVKGAAEKLGSRFENIGTDVQVRVKDAADYAVKASKTAVEFNRENVEAVIESGKITAKGATEIGKTNMKYGRENLVEASRALQGLFSVATPKDFFEKQTDYARSGLDRIMDQTSNNADAVVKLAGKAYQPIADRLAEIQKDLKKAA